MRMNFGDIDFNKVSKVVAGLLPKTDKINDRKQLLWLVPRALVHGACVIADDDTVEQYGCMGVACQIGDNAFYFAGESYDNIGEYMEGRDFPRIVADVVGGLETLRDELDEDEFAYYLETLRFDVRHIAEINN